MQSLVPAHDIPNAVGAMTICQDFPLFACIVQGSANKHLGIQAKTLV
jgi:hypothetical protein